MVTVSLRLTWSPCKLHGHLVKIVALHPVTEIKMADRIWGWREFFDMVSSLLAAASWQYGTANQRYSEYVVERLGMCGTYNGYHQKCN